MEITRRGLFKLTATAGLGVGIAQGARFVPGGIAGVDVALDQPLFRDQPDDLLPSACPLCPAGCGLRLRRVGHALCGIRPDAADRASGGALCPKAYGLLQELVHSARLAGPVRRASRGGAWQEARWPEALDGLASMLKGPARVAFVLPHADPTLSGAAIECLARSLGARVYRLGWGPGQGPVDALRLACGARDAIPDLESARCIASFGADWLQESPNPARAQAAYGRLRSDEMTRARLTMVSPRFGVTAMKSDAWHACAPGTEGAVALAVAGLLLQDVSRRPSGVKGVEKVEAAIARDFTPQRAAQLSGVPAKAIAAIARDLGSLAPSVAVGARGRLCDQWAVVILNCVLGAIGRKGGMIPVEPDLALRALGVPEGKTLSADRFCEDLVAGAVAADAVVFYHCNPAYASPEPGRWKAALARVPHVVHIGPYRDETAALADLVLPAAMMAEREDLVVAPTAGGVAVRRFAATAAPAGGVLPPMGIAIEVARRTQAGAFPWTSPAEAIEQAAARAATLSPSPSGPVALDLEGALDEAGRLWSEPSFTAGECHLEVIFTPAFSGGYGGHLPYLHSATSPVLRTWWRTYVEIHPATAARLGIQDGGRVRLSSEKGQIEAIARTFPGVREDTVAMPFGLGRGEGSDLVRGDGSNPALLVSARRDAPEGAPLWGHQKVQVSKATS